MKSGIWFSKELSKNNKFSLKIILKFYVKQVLSSYILYIIFTTIYYKQISLKIFNKGDDIVKFQCEKSILSNIFLYTIWSDKTNMVWKVLILKFSI